MKKYLLFTILAAFVFAGCEKEKKQTASITGIKWHLTKFVDPLNHTETEPVPASNTNYYWVKMCDGTLHGYGNVNEILANYSISGHQIIIDVLGQTKIYPMNNHFENDFFAAIGKAKSFLSDGKVLQLYYEDTKYLQFERIME